MESYVFVLGVVVVVGIAAYIIYHSAAEEFKKDTESDVKPEPQHFDAPVFSESTEAKVKPVDEAPKAKKPRAPRKGTSAPASRSKKPKASSKTS